MPETEVSNKQVILKHYIVGCPKESDMGIRTSKLPFQLQAGSKDVLLKNLYLSADPYMRHRMADDHSSYIPPFTPGQPLDGFGLGKVVLSNHPDFKENEYVTAWTRWEEYSVIPGGQMLKVVDPSIVPLSYHLSCLGMPGFTAYAGLLDILKPKKGETIFVSAASGAVGQIAGQLAKLEGCHVVGTASTQRKIDLLKNQFGYDEVFNHKEETDYCVALKKYCPSGIDMYFENVGGKLLEAVVENMNKFGRIAVCGLISQYNVEKKEGITDLFKFISKRLTMRGFLQEDHLHLQPEFLEKVTGYLKEKKLVCIEDFCDGLESGPAALIKLLEGTNVGKQIVTVAPE